VSLRLVPVSQAVAHDCVTRWHRHNAAPPSEIFRIGVADDTDMLVAVALGGRPVARAYDDGFTIEVTRVSSDGTRNATSMLYAACARVAFGLGGRTAGGVRAAPRRGMRGLHLRGTITRVTRSAVATPRPDGRDLR
jgi:hypothetical protein